MTDETFDYEVDIDTDNIYYDLQAYPGAKILGVGKRPHETRGTVVDVLVGNSLTTDFLKEVSRVVKDRGFAINVIPEKQYNG